MSEITPEQLKRLNEIPQAMQALTQWLLWKYEPKENNNRLNKIPYYTNGHKRWGEQGGSQDRSMLVDFETALKCLAIGGYDGIGFAFLPGDNLIGIDLDHMIEAGTDKFNSLALSIENACDSYTERSPSGQGLHIICEGEIEHFKSDRIGVEIYCQRQFFACTGDFHGDAPKPIGPLSTPVREWLRSMVKDAKGLDRLDREQRARAAQIEGGAPQRVVTNLPTTDKGYFAIVNAAALVCLDAWVPVLLPGATRTSAGGWRVSSKALGRDMEEDLSFHPRGIRDFGTREGFSAIDSVARHLGVGKQEALLWLAPKCGIVLRTRTSVSRDQAFGPQNTVPDAVTESKKSCPVARSDFNSGQSKPSDLEVADFLSANYAYLIGTENAWDCQNQKIVTLRALSVDRGKKSVDMWMERSRTSRRSEAGRWSIPIENVIFDPQQVFDPDLYANTFDGIEMKPIAGDVGPFLELIDLLVQRTGRNPNERSQYAHWLLCWMAAALQRTGLKLRSAVLIFGDEGTGKNLICSILQKIYGKKWSTIVSQDEIMDRFNDWREDKLLGIADEVSSPTRDGIQAQNRVKSLVTSPAGQVNPKGIKRREKPNHINFWLNSNQIKPVLLDNSDRRFFVLYSAPRQPDEFYERVGEWIDDGGPAFVFNYLLDYDITDFSEYAPPPVTQAKKDLIALNRPTAERFWVDWSAGRLNLPYWSCTKRQLYRAYKSYASRVGDKNPAMLEEFIRMVARISDTFKKPIIEMEIRVHYGADSLNSIKGTRKTEMILIVAPPDSDLTQFATECYRKFGIALAQFLLSSKREDTFDGNEPPSNRSKRSDDELDHD